MQRLVSQSDIADPDATLQVGPAAEMQTPGSAGSSLDRYVVIEEIGRGGMGVVLRAYDPKLQREVALKVLRAASPEAETRLVREAQAMAQLNHPNVVAVYDVAVRGEDAQSQVALAMEFVPGTDLRHWLQQQERSCDAILEAFVAAGRGLAAAHTQGLLHRDFKPDNVLVGDDGRVRVTDFGLARLSSSPSDDSMPSSFPSGSEGSASQDRLTELGTVMGTPRFMPPEQHGAVELSPAADQYAFCVSLWFALTGEYPFSGRSIRDLQEVKLQGPPPWPKGGTVPPRVADALARGLSPRPEDRYPTMDALLGVLVAQPPTARRSWIAAGLAIGVLSAAAWAFVATDQAARCTGAEQQLAQIWSAQRRGSIQDAFATAKVSYGAQAWERLSPRLDEWTASWVRMHTETCEATQLRGEQSAAAMDLRMGCLHRASLKLDAVAGVLEGASPGVIERAHEIVDGLPDLDDCADLEALRSDVPPPSATQAPAVEEIRATIARSEARRGAAEYDAALEEATAAESSAAAIGYEPVMTEALLVLADAQIGVAKYAEAEANARRALELATRLGQRNEQRLAALSLMTNLGFHAGKPDQGLVLRDVAHALSLGNPRHEAFYRANLARVLQAAGRLQEAEREQRVVLDITSELLSEDHPDLATVHMNLSGILFDQARYEEAEAESRTSLELAIRAHGRRHPWVARSMVNTANNMLETDRYPEAIELYGDAIDIFTATLGPDHPTNAAAYSNLAGVYYRQGKFDDSLAALDKATKIRIQTYGPGHVEVANSRTNLAAIYNRTGRPKDALVEHQAAHAIYLERLGPEHPLVLTAQQNMGSVHLSLGEYRAAEKILRETVTRQIEILGPDHADVLSSRNNLGSALLNLGAYDEAESIFRDVLEQRTELFGPEHHEVGQAWGNLSNVLAVQGRLDESEETQRTALRIRVSAQGAEHQDVAMSRHNLAALLYDKGDYRAALAQEEDALRIWVAALGERHLWVAEAHGGLGQIHAALGHDAQAERELRAGVEIAEYSGSDHPVVAERLVALGEFLLDARRRSDAREVLERAWNIADDRIGETTERATAAFALARALESDPANRTRAVQLAQRARTIYSRVGNAHAETSATIDRWLAKHPDHDRTRVEP